MIRIKGGGEPIAKDVSQAGVPKGYKRVLGYERLAGPIAKLARKNKRAVTKPRGPAKVRRTGKVKAPSPPPAQEAKVGRPKTHATAADRQRAYRERQKEAKA